MASPFMCAVLFFYALIGLSAGLDGLQEASPRGQAEKMIRALGLVPELENSVNMELDAEESTPQLTEKRIHLDIRDKSGAAINTEELGHHAGYFDLPGTHKSRMFYFFFETRGDKEKDPLLLWMTGGPGCGSEVAMFYENGPFHITDKLELVWNDYGWDKISSIIFVDQPIGTGFSYSKDIRDYRHDEAGVTKDMYAFLQAFYSAHPEYKKNDFFVTGESYAGHYVPAVTSYIHYKNKKSSDFSINLKGFAIGNGLTEPDIQYQAYADYALDMKLIDEIEHKKISKIYPACLTSIKLCGDKGVITCVAAYMICQTIFSSIMATAGNINYYDVRKQCDDGGLCYDFSNMDNYLNDKAVQEALGVDNRKFVDCNPIVYEAMLVDWMRNLEKGIPTLLEDGIKLLVYAGEYDLICNWLGNSRWVEAMSWSGQQAYANASWGTFEVDGKEAGIFSGYGPLSFIKVHDAGHMVPMDQPKNSLEMMYRWTRGNPLASSSAMLITQRSQGATTVQVSSK